MDDCEISGFPSPAWTNLLDSHAILAIQRAQPMTLALPCIGIDACSQALLDMRVPFVVKYAYDVKACLARPLTALHGDISHFRLGHIDGGLLAADVHAWERVDGVVAGPPCPPWSQCGKRGSWTDPRAQVFGKVSDIIVDQGHKAAHFFILEMVPGMDEMRSWNVRTRHSTPFAAWLADLSTRAPMWEVHVWQMDTANYLPQHRERIYAVGVNKHVAYRSPQPPRRPAPEKRIMLSHLLHPGIEPNQEQDLPARLRWNLFSAKMRFRDRMRRLPETGHGSGNLAAEIDRSPDGTWNFPLRCDGCTPTLRANGAQLLWVVLPDHGISRALHPVERLTLQGFPPEVAQGLSKAEVVHAAGNACSVPVMGAVLVQVLLACQPTLLPDSHCPLNAWTDHGHAETLQQLRVAALCTEVAWLQAQTSVLKREQEWVEELTRTLLRRREQALRRASLAMEQ